MKVLVAFSVFVLLLFFYFDATIVHVSNSTFYVEGAAVATELYGLNMTATSDFKQGSPGSEVLFSLELRNLGTANDTIDIEVKDTFGWSIEVDPTHLPLEIEEASNATVRVNVSEDALIGQTNVITIIALSSGDAEASAKAYFSVEVVTPFWEIPDVRFIIGYLIGVFVGTTLTLSVIFRRTKIIHKGNPGETDNV